MQVILTQLIVAFVLISASMFITDFVCSVPRTPQSIIVAESPVESIVPVVPSPVVPPIYATLEWVYQVPDIEEAVNEMPDIVAIARSRMPQLNVAAMSIRELKKLASDRKLKGYSKLNKAQLIAAMS